MRPYLDKDFAVISRWITDERSHALWCANLIPYPLEQAKFHDVILEAGNRFDDTPFVATTDQGEVIGFFNFSVNLETNEGFLKFIVIDQSIRNMGYGTEMIKLALRYAFEIAKADAVQLNVFPENPRAKKCYLKIGFTERSFTEKAFCFGEELWGRCNMIITKETWLAAFESWEHATQKMEKSK